MARNIEMRERVGSFNNEFTLSKNISTWLNYYYNGKLSLPDGLKTGLKYIATEVLQQLPT